MTRKLKRRKKKTPNLGTLATRMMMVSSAIMESLMEVDTYGRKIKNSIFDMLTFRLIPAK